VRMGMVPMLRMPLNFSRPFTQENPTRHHEFSDFNQRFIEC